MQSLIASYLKASTKIVARFLTKPTEKNILLSVGNLSMVILVLTKLGLDKAFALYNRVEKLLCMFAKFMLVAVPTGLTVNFMTASVSGKI